MFTKDSKFCLLVVGLGGNIFPEVKNNVGEYQSWWGYFLLKNGRLIFSHFTEIRNKNTFPFLLTVNYISSNIIKEKKGEK